RQRQYVTPPDDFFVDLLDFNFLNQDGHPMMYLTLRDLGTSSVNGNIRFWLDNRQDLFRGQVRRSNFFRDWSVTGETLTRNDQKYDFRMPLSSGELQLAYSQVNMGGMENTTPENWEMQVADVKYIEDFKEWQAGAGFQHEKFSISEGDNFSGKTNSFNVNAATTGDERTSIAANASYSKTTLNEFDGGPRSYSFAIEGIHVVNDTVTLLGEVSHYDVSSAITENAYASGNTGAEIRADFTGIERTKVSVGGSLKQVDYVNGPHTATIDAKVKNLFAKISSRLTKNLKLKAAVSHTNTDDRPSAIDLTGMPYGALPWSSKNDYRVELAYTTDWQSGLTGRWRSRSWNNSDFVVDNLITGYDVFGWWMPVDELTLYATYLDQNFDLDGLSNSDSYVSDSNTYVFGATYQPTPEWMLDFSVSDSEASGGVGVNQEVFALGLSYTWPTGEQISFRGAFDRFATSEQATFLDYDSDWFEIKLSKSF
ncbi:hypothetical protein KKB99_03300, partial [bacterium]|nr:hypothetical protein [bacterium]MBU1025017.1 hypothetical protein [bacterium]